MKEVLIYECEDGTRFDIKEKAERYDEVLEKIKQIMAPLGEPVKEEYSAKQRNRNDVENAVLELMHLCALCIPEWAESFESVKDLYHMKAYIVGRVISDYSRDWKCLHDAFFRLSCTSDKTYIEYEQPYWTTHEYEYEKALKVLAEYKKQRNNS